MKTLNAPDTISGKEGRAYAKINGNNEELFYAKTIEATVEKSKGEVKSIGKRMTGHKTTGRKRQRFHDAVLCDAALPGYAVQLEDRRWGPVL